MILLLLLFLVFQPGNAQQQDTLTRPSGHALFAFLTAYAIGKHFKNPFLKAGNNCIGLKGPASRSWEGEHWLTDVAVSMVLGVAVVEPVDGF